MGKSHSHIVKGRTPSTRGKVTLGYKDILISNHAKLRCLERVPAHILPHYNETEIKKFAARARKSGWNISYMNRLSDEELLEMDITRTQAEHIYEKYTPKLDKMHSCKCYYYKYFIFYFAGGGSRTLISVIPALPDGDMDIVLDQNHIPLKAYADNLVAEVG